MEHGQVRAILGRHAAGVPPGARADPTLLVPASTLRAALDGRPDAEQRALARDYVALWARTFRTLARHLRGRPERALALFAEEVYPFLRGDRRAARVERLGAAEARVLLPTDLPDAYHAGLLESFVAVSGADARAQPQGNGVFTVAFRLHGGLRLARASQAVSQLRVPLLLAALLAALVGLGFARPIEADVSLAVIAGTLAAQAGANLLHVARRRAGQTRAGHPFGPATLPRPAALVLCTGLYTVAAGCAAWLAVAAARPGVLAFAAVGLALGLTYARVRQRGLGPVLAAATYGMLLPLGAAYAGGLSLADPIGLVVLLAFALPLGLLCAAQLFLDNVADRPLDEAGGQRTLAVRLPQGRQAIVVTGFAGGAALLLVAASFPAFSPFHLLLGLLVGAAAAGLAAAVHRHGDDPQSLAPARLWAVLLMTAVGAFQAWWLVGA